MDLVPRVLRQRESLRHSKGTSLQKIIWSCWLQGRDSAPELVRKCLQSWELRNPGWDFRCLDAATIGRYVDLGDYVDLTRQQITAASLADLLRLLLLHEYGGVWVDATTFCNAPLDEWIAQASQTGFFAFARPAEDRELATWCIAAHPGNQLMAKWAARSFAYWNGRTATRDYFWVHHQFGELISVDPEAFAAWQRVPRISADGPHTVQTAGVYASFDEVQHQVDWSASLFKLTHRLDNHRIQRNSLVSRLLDLCGQTEAKCTEALLESAEPCIPISQLRVKTENVGDHIQILAAEHMLRRAGLTPSNSVDRDDEIAEQPPGSEPTGILLNGWFKTNPAQWPPHPDYVPVYLGFHIRLFQSPSLTGPDALAHYRKHGPIGCRDRYTLSLLRSHKVEAFLSHCLTLCFPRRLPNLLEQTEVFVVSRDRALLERLPNDLGPYHFVSHYSGMDDFTRNLDLARGLLETYRTRAKLIVTSMLHCALPAIAMGIPVIVIYPPNSEAGGVSDKERFSSLSDIVRVFELSEINLIDWRGYCPDVSNIKLRLVDSFFAETSKWGRLATASLDGFAPAAALPLPDGNDSYSYFDDPERLQRLSAALAADRQKWGRKSSYRGEWADRGRLAAQFIDNGETVLELGAGAGTFRDLVADRCDYRGADLQPIDPQFLTFNLETDAMPPGRWDAVVMLGVLEYIYRPQEAMSKVFSGTAKVVMSYCFPLNGDVAAARASRGWVSDLSEAQLVEISRANGFELIAAVPFNSADDFDQKIVVFRRNANRNP
jgi:hypothetical protein